MLTAPSEHMGDDGPEDRLKDLHERLCDATERVEELRREAAELTADLRNQLNAVTLQRRVLQRRREEDRRAA